jgi:hypothetical protein
MSKGSVVKGVLVVSLVVGSLVFLFFEMFPYAHWRFSPKLPLPGGYFFGQSASNRFAIFDAKGRVAVPHALDAIQVHQHFVYGSLPERPHGSFVFDTATGELGMFDDYEKFDRFLRKNDLPSFSSHESFTYWDVIEKNPRLNR